MSRLVLGLASIQELQSTLGLLLPGVGVAVGSGVGVAVGSGVGVAVGSGVEVTVASGVGVEGRRRHRAGFDLVRLLGSFGVDG